MNSGLRGSASLPASVGYNTCYQRSKSRSERRKAENCHLTLGRENTGWHRMCMCTREVQGILVSEACLTAGRVR